MLGGGRKQKFDAIFALERSINGSSPNERVAARRKDIAPLVNDLIEWMKRERGKLSRHNEVAKAMGYMLKRIDVFTRFLDDGRICLSNNAAERELRGIALGRKSWLFAGSDRPAERARLRARCHGPRPLPAVFLAAHCETPFATRAARRRRGVFHWRQRAARRRNRTQRVRAIRAISTSGVWQKPK